MMRGFINIMKSAWRAFKNADFISDKYILVMISLGTLINIGLWYYLKYTLGPSDSFKITHYTFASGADLLGKASDIYDLVYIAIIFTVVNIIITRIVYGYDALMAYMTISMVPVLNIFIFFQGFLLVQVNR